MSKHTKGPWRVIKKERAVGYAEYEIAYSDEGELVCDIVYEEVDARLIAQAPDMLEMLKRVDTADRLTRSYEGVGRLVNELIPEIRALIKKAEGE